jgi:hypothetical protein
MGRVSLAFAVADLERTDALDPQPLSLAEDV